MNRGGGWNGGRSGGGNGGGGPRGRNNNNNRGAVVRFPSDLAARRDGKFNNQNVRFPSDSNAKENPVPSFLRNDRKNEGPQGGRDPIQGQGQGQGQGRDARTRDSSNRGPQARDNRGPQGRGGGPRRDARPRRDNRGRNDVQKERVDQFSPDVAVEQGNTSHIDPFDLFCVYHLGITNDGGYRAPTLNDAARRFNVSPGVIKQALIDHRLDPDAVARSGFDMAMAQVDIQVSPPGVSKRELARGIYEDFLHTASAPRADYHHDDEEGDDEKPDELDLEVDALADAVV